MSDDPVVAALSRLEAGQAELRARVVTLRVDLMACLNRLQARMDSLDEHLTFGLGYSDRMERRAQSVSEDNRMLGEQIMTLTKLLQQLEGRVNDLEERKQGRQNRS